MAGKTRKSAPKVRSGCLTCKTRHLKCDEEKPTCLRCRKDQFQCDGYLPACAKTQTRLNSKAKSCAAQLPLQLNTGISGSRLEKYFFHHVRELTIKDLCTSETGFGFWYRLVLPAAHSDDSVKHALIALGMAHELFIGHTSNAEHEHFMLKHYNSAISRLTPKMSAPEFQDLPVTLICCLIFFCLENITGDYARSLEHLRAGSKLLSSHMDSIWNKDATKSPNSSDEVGQIAEMFSNLGVDASFFMDEPIVPDLSSYVKLGVDEAEGSATFSNLAEARTSLNTITVKFNTVVEACRNDWYAPEMLAIYDRFRQWATRFDNAVFHFKGGAPSQAELRELVGLRLCRQIWLAVIDCGPQYPAASSRYDQTFSEALDKAEHLLTSLSSPYPVFTIEGDVVPAVAYVCDITSNPKIQRRAIDLLRSVKRREGMWDSQEIAEYLEAYVLAKEMLQLNWENVPGGLPGSVRVLSGLDLLTLSPGNGIFRMANSPEFGQSGRPESRKEGYATLLHKLHSFGGGPISGYPSFMRVRRGEEETQKLYHPPLYQPPGMVKVVEPDHEDLLECDAYRQYCPPMLYSDLC